MTDHVRFVGRPDLERPVLIAAFEGWNDAGDAATGAVEHLELVWDAQPITELDPEEYYDFQVNRPTVSLVDGVARRVTWPTTRFSVCRPPGANFDLVLVRGIEPNMRWRTFCRELLGVIHELEIRTVVTLGALLSDTPHTRPLQVTGVAHDAESAARHGLDKSRYEGPTGIVGVLNIACREQGLATASVWANVPHYVSGIENPKAALALVRRVLLLLNAEADLSDLSEAARQFEQNLNGIVAQNGKIAEYVAKLERKKPEDDDGGQRDELPPSGDLVAEIEQFLRQQRPDSS